MLIGTDRFRSTLVATRNLSGVPDAQWAEVAHPVQSLDRDALRRIAASVVVQFVDIVLER